MRNSKWIGFVAGLAALLILFSLLSETVSTGSSAGYAARWHNVLKDFKSQKPHTIDVVVLGDSESYTSVDTMRLWHKRGITAYVLGQPADAPGFFNVAAIESPGLTAAPAIGEWTAREIAGYTGASENRNFNGSRKGIPHVAEMAPAERAALIASRPDYGRIVCRCENVSEGEIRDAIRRTLGARSLDGVKRRVRQGMGRCQAGFCTPGAIAILAEELGIPEEQVTKNRPGSELLVREDEI